MRVSAIIGEHFHCALFRAFAARIELSIRSTIVPTFIKIQSRSLKTIASFIIQFSQGIFTRFYSYILVYE